MIEPQWELAQLEAHWHALETKVEELKAKAAKAGAKDMAEFVRQIAALRQRSICSPALRPTLGTLIIP